MALSRTDVYDALWAKLDALDYFTTREQVVRHWADLQPEDMPYLALAMKNQRQEQQQRTPAKVTMPFELYIYVHRKGASESPARLLMQAIDYVQNGLYQGPALTTQTLGLSNVHHCYINGTIETDEGALGDVGVAVVPIEILATQ
jgi:hypothetical protein